ncbi:cell division protein FtsQ/DivIB, partial [Streptomyces lancefieldiae]
LDMIDLHELEVEIAQNTWVRKAELFFDNNLVLHVNVIEKEPVARVFTENGSSFYIDSSGGRLPLSDKMSVNLRVFTSFPEVNGVWNSKDSALVQDVKKISGYVLHDEFWMAQVAQISCEKDGSFELVP